MRVQHLADLIDKSGKSKSFLADKMNISRTNFYSKLSGRVEFKASELLALMSEIGITDIDEIRNILDGEEEE